ncbi:hypothetical protein Tco_1121051 [Tanacetum coccineum]|uniref:Uncharacterized protein n=1 Tax=Tanacetum coccineum TaxID=301880 RepID=A0ABQ5IX00_9ASTR
MGGWAGAGERGCVLLGGEDRRGWGGGGGAGCAGVEPSRDTGRALGAVGVGEMDLVRQMWSKSVIAGYGIQPGSTTGCRIGDLLVNAHRNYHSKSVRSGTRDRRADQSVAGIRGGGARGAEGWWLCVG